MIDENAPFSLKFLFQKKIYMVGERQMRILFNNKAIITTYKIGDQKPTGTLDCWVLDIISCVEKPIESVTSKNTFPIPLNLMQLLNIPQKYTPEIKYLTEVSPRLRFQETLILQTRDFTPKYDRTSLVEPEIKVKL